MVEEAKELGRVMAKVLLSLSEKIAEDKIKKAKEETRSEIEKLRTEVKEAFKVAASTFKEEVEKSISSK